MIEEPTAAGAAETRTLGTCPNRQGHLVLGDCPLPETPVPEPCLEGPRDCSFGILHCRCLRARGLFVLSSAPITLRPHDLRRLKVKAICSL
jgi:hypothetical protein